MMYTSIYSCSSLFFKYDAFMSSIFTPSKTDSVLLYLHVDYRTDLSYSLCVSLTLCPYNKTECLCHSILISLGVRVSL